MRILTMLAIGCAGSALLAGGARAADPAQSWPEPEAPIAPRFTELMSGWYLRGDIGYRRNAIGGTQLAPTSTSGAVTSEYFSKDTYSGTVGAGYKLGFLRADVTADFGSPMSYRANAALGGANYYNASVSATTLLANAYLDMGTWGGFTPYVGAGIGASYLRAAKFLTPLSTSETTVTTISMSWAAMAGVSYQFASNLALDIGYRYINFGNARAGDPAVNTDYLQLNKLTAQEVRIGLRLLLD